MASDYTSHYHLDKYVATDKPNLRDQYNAAMDKIDDALYTSNTNAADAKAAAQRAEGAVAGKASQTDLNALSQTVAGKASQTDLNALSALLPSGQFSAQNTVKAGLDALEQRMANIGTGAFQGTNIMCVNDSWGSNSAEYGVTYNWMQMVCAVLRANYIDLHLGSTGYINSHGTGGRQGNYIQRLQAWVANTANDPSSIDYIFMMGGINDVNSTHSEVRNAIQNTIAYINATFPKAIIYLMPQIIGGDPSRISFNSPNFNAWAKIASFSYGLDGVTKRRVIFDDKLLYCLCGNSSLMHTDMVHPNQAGHNAIASAFLKSIAGGTVRAPIYNADLIQEVKCNNVVYSLEGSSLRASIVNNVLKVAGTVTLNAGTPNTVNAVRVYLKDIVGVNVEPYNTQPIGFGMVYDFTGNTKVSPLEINFYNNDNTNINSATKADASFLNLLRAYPGTFDLSVKTVLCIDATMPLVYD